MWWVQEATTQAAKRRIDVRERLDEVSDMMQVDKLVEVPQVRRILRFERLVEMPVLQR